jgi:hypothetical protein
MESDFTVEDKRALDNKGVLKDGAKVDSGSGGNPQESHIPDKANQGPSVVEKILSGDVLGKFINAGLIPKKYTVNHNHKLEENEDFKVVAYETPWCFVNNSSDRKCSFNLDIAMIFELVPRQCRNCWKIVVYPHTVRELLQLKKLMEKMAKANPYCYCKCGIEKRPWTERNYGGYFYTESLEEGLLRLGEVREKVAKHISPDMKVILKRGCTELERAFGDSALWDDKFENDLVNMVEDQLQALFTIKPQFAQQSTLVQNHVIATWIFFAAERGDPTVKELNHGKGLYPDYRNFEVSDVIYRDEGEKDEGNKK